MFRRNVLGAAALLVVAGVVGTACGLGGGGGANGSASRSLAGEGSVDAGAPGTAPAAKPPLVGGEFQLTVVGPRIVKNGSVTIQIKAGSFGSRAADVMSIAGRYGGFVASTQTGGGKLLSGTIVLRVPASQFEAALGDLRRLGKVTEEHISGRDVTAQFVDLEARLRNWEAQEVVLLKLMARSKSIEESLKVQRALQDVQLAIEEIRGQLRVLNDQTDLATIALSLAERTPVAAPNKANPFLRSWRAAVHVTLAVLTAIIVGLGYLAPVLLLGLVVGGIGLLVFRRFRPRIATVPVERDR